MFVKMLQGRTVSTNGWNKVILEAGVRYEVSEGLAASLIRSGAAKQIQVKEVEVDVDLGTVKVLHVWAAHDVGAAINPTQVEGQVHGGVAQGLGLALMEDYLPGRTENLHDYLIPTFGDVPPIDVYLIEDPEPTGPYGAKGIGEPALIPTPPAIFGAIHHATGVRMKQAPATPDRVRAAILAAQGEK